MRDLRRTYFYLVALISLLAGVIALAGLAGSMALAQFADGFAPSLRQGPGLPWLVVALIALPVWGLHWFSANRPASATTRSGASERNAGIRKAYLYSAQFGLLAIVGVQSGLALFTFFLVALRQPLPPQANWRGAVVANLAGALIALFFWSYHAWTTAKDGDYGHEMDSGAGWRRGYHYLGAGLSTLVSVLAAGEFMRTFLRIGGQVYFFGLGEGDAAMWRRIVAGTLAAVVVGLPLAVRFWREANRVAGDDPTGEEMNALGRKFFLYAGMAAGAAMTLVSLGYLLWQLLMLILGRQPDSLQAFWEQAIVPPLAYLPLGLLVWPTFSHVATSDAAWASEGREAAMLRRLYYYLMAAIGLAAFWYGLQALLVLASVLLLRFWNPSVLFAERVREFFSLAAALVIVGGPAWWGHWQVQQQRAREPGLDGADERRSALRKVYLYGVVVAAAIVVIATLAIVIARAPGWLFGPTVPGSFAQSLVELGVGISLALFWWISHAFVLRGDEHLQTEDARLQYIMTERPRFQERDFALAATARPDMGEPQMAEMSARRAPAATVAAAGPGFGREATVVVVDGSDGALGASLLLALRIALPHVRLWPLGLNERARAAMLAALNEQSLPDMPLDAMKSAAVILGPSDIVAPGGLHGEVPSELAAAMAASPAHKVLLPARDPRLRWVAAPDWPEERWVQYAVDEVIDALAGP